MLFYIVKYSVIDIIYLFFKAQCSKISESFFTMLVVSDDFYKEIPVGSLFKEFRSTKNEIKDNNESIKYGKYP